MDYRKESENIWITYLQKLKKREDILCTGSSKKREAINCTSIILFTGTTKRENNFDVDHINSLKKYNWIHNTH